MTTKKAARKRGETVRDSISVPFLASEIDELFDHAVIKSQALERIGSIKTRYAEGVRDALGWVLGQYPDKPEL
jgi:hypothetical protein